ncbi:Ester hydrolase C11orf54 [Sciurus carolinensis]|uniref:Ester hydrolase C11orf54 n=1 Tax=Sciurus carolinensis TaxID=30640 RepID=A0AA41T5M3_SCICA|nr:Ester hydrolase C11orf54 [Sciurus carolinensis]
MAHSEFSFHVPSLEELAAVLQKGLKDNFADVQVSVVDCPDLTKEPFTFPVKGICGKTRIAEVGGVPYLIPLVNKKKVYDLNTIAKEIKLPGAFILGAGAGPFQTLGFNSEFMPVIQAESEHNPPVNGSYFARINPADGGCLLEKYSQKYHDFGCALLANLFASEGQPGKGFDLRLEHTHFFSHHGEGGHYHYDTTPDTVEYLGYFLPAEFLYRIDQPKETHSFGRD